MKYLEIDTRVSRDGKIYINHNPATGQNHSCQVVFKETDSSQLNTITFKNGEELLSLANTLEIFSRLSNLGQILCIDIKDFGFEKEHLKLVKQFNLEDRVAFVSWIPQTLISLAELGTSSPLVLSHFNTTVMGNVGKILTKACRKLILPFSHFVLLGQDSYSRPLGDKSVGYQHAILLHTIPDSILKMLTINGGGICTHRSMATRKLSQYCKQVGLSLWVFSASTISTFDKCTKELNADVVFCETNLF
ncbi:MAG: hypothetical protein AB7E47_10105 [Desulfovibrionaceae bacterium]